MMFLFGQRGVQVALLEWHYLEPCGLDLRNQQRWQNMEGAGHADESPACARRGEDAVQLVRQVRSKRFGECELRPALRNGSPCCYRPEGSFKGLADSAFSCVLQLFCRHQVPLRLYGFLALS